MLLLEVEMFHRLEIINQPATESVLGKSTQLRS